MYCIEQFCPACFHAVTWRVLDSILQQTDRLRLLNVRFFSRLTRGLNHISPLKAKLVTISYHFRPEAAHTETRGREVLSKPCNKSCVSYACGNSTHSVVHEPIVIRLGALRPSNGTTVPPIPQCFPNIHSYKWDRY